MLSDAEEDDDERMLLVDEALERLAAQAVHRSTVLCWAPIPQGLGSPCRVGAPHSQSSQCSGKFTKPAGSGAAPETATLCGKKWQIDKRVAFRYLHGV